MRGRVQNVGNRGDYANQPLGKARSKGIPPGENPRLLAVGDVAQVGDVAVLLDGFGLCGW